MAAKVKKPLVSILMGSQSDWGVMSHAAQKLDDLGIPWEAQAISAHRATDALMKYLATTEKRGIEVIIAGAGGAAHLPGVISAKVTLPVLGPGILSGGLFAFLLSWGNFPLSAFVTGADSTVPEWLFSKMTVAYTPMITTIGTMSVAASMVILFAGYFIVRRLTREKA